MQGRLKIKRSPQSLCITAWFTDKLWYCGRPNTPLVYFDNILTRYIRIDVSISTLFWCRLYCDSSFHFNTTTSLYCDCSLPFISMLWYDSAAIVASTSNWYNCIESDVIPSTSLCFFDSTSIRLYDPDFNSTSLISKPLLIDDTLFGYKRCTSQQKIKDMKFRNFMRFYEIDIDSSLQCWTSISPMRV